MKSKKPVKVFVAYGNSLLFIDYKIGKTKASHVVRSVNASEISAYKEALKELVLKNHGREVIFN